MTTYGYGSMITDGTTFSLTAEPGERPKAAPKGLIATQAVQTRSGWLGQVFVDKRIVFESPTPHDSSEDAIDEANAKVVATVTGLFTDPAIEPAAE